MGEDGEPPLGDPKEPSHVQNQLPNELGFDAKSSNSSSAESSGSAGDVMDEAKRLYQRAKSRRDSMKNLSEYDDQEQLEELAQVMADRGLMRTLEAMRGHRAMLALFVQSLLDGKMNEFTGAHLEAFEDAGVWSKDSLDSEEKHRLVDLVLILIDHLRERNDLVAGLSVVSAQLEIEQIQYIQKIRDMEAKNIELRRNQMMLQESAKTHQQEATQLAKRMDATEEEAIAENSRVSWRTVEITRKLQKAVDMANRKSRVNNDELLKKIQSLEEKATKQQEERDRLSEELAEAVRTLANVQKDLSTKLETCQNEAAADKERRHNELQEKERLIEKLMEAKNESSALLEETRNRLSERDSTIQQVQRSLLETSKKLDEEIESHSECKKHMSAKIADFKIEIDKEKVKRQTEANEYSIKMEGKEEQIKSLTEAAKRLSQDTDQTIEELRKLAETKEEEKHHLRTRISEEAGKRLDSKLSEAEGRFKDVQLKHDQVSSKLVEVEVRERRLIEDMNLKSDMISQLEITLSSSKAEIGDKARELNSLLESHKQTLDMHSVTVSQMERELAAATTALETQRVNNESLKSQMISKKESSDETKRDLSARVQSLKSNLDDKERELARQKEELEMKLLSAQRAVDVRTEDLEEADRRARQLQTTQEKVAQHCKEVEVKLSSAEREIEDLTKQKELLETEKASFSTRLRESTADARQTVDSEREKFCQQIADLRSALSEEKQQHEETEKGNATVITKWKEAAMEARQEGDERARSVKVACQQRIDTQQQKLSEIRSTLEIETERSARLADELELLRRDHHKWTGESETRASQQYADELKTVTKHHVVKHQETVNKHTSEISELQEQIKFEIARNDQLLKKEKETLAAHIEEVRNIRTEHSSKIDTLHNEITATRKTITEKVDDAANRTKEEIERAAQTEAKLQKSIDDLRKREEELMTQLSEAAERTEEAANWGTKQIEAEKNTHTDLEHLLVKSRSDYQEVLRSSGKLEHSAREDRQAAEAKLREMQGSLSAYTSQVDTLRLQLKEHQSALTASQQRCSSLEHGNSQRVADVANELQQSRERETKLEIRVEQLQQQYEDSQIQTNRAKEVSSASAEETAQLRNECREQNRRAALFEGQVAKLSDETRELQLQSVQSKEMLSDLHTELEIANRRRADDMRAKVEDVKQQSPIRSEGNVHEQFLKTENARLQKEITDAKSSLKKSEKKLSSTTEELETTSRELRGQLKVVQHEKSNLSETVREQEAKLADLEDKFYISEISNRSSRDEIACETEVRNHLEREILDLKQGLEKNNSAKTDLSCKVAELQIQVRTQAEDTRVKLRKMRDMHNEEISEFQARAQDNTTILAELQTSQRLKDDALDRSTAEVRHLSWKQNRQGADTLQVQVNELRGLVDEKEGQIAAERQRNEILTTELRALRRGADQQRSVSTRLRTQLLAVEGEKTTIQSNKEHFKALADKSQQDNRQQHQELEKKLFVERTRSAALESSIHELEQKVSQQQRESIILQRENEALSSDKKHSSISKAEDDHRAGQATEELQKIQSSHSDVVRSHELLKKEFENTKLDALRFREREIEAIRERDTIEERYAALREEIVKSSADNELANIERATMRDALVAADRREAQLRDTLRKTAEQRAAEYSTTVSILGAHQSVVGPLSPGGVV